jgi:hypothetical protein
MAGYAQLLDQIEMASPAQLAHDAGQLTLRIEFPKEGSFSVPLAIERMVEDVSEEPVSVSATDGMPFCLVLQRYRPPRSKRAGKGVPVCRPGTSNPGKCLPRHRGR